jgi:hypothetical protein
MLCQLSLMQLRQFRECRVAHQTDLPWFITVFAISLLNTQHLCAMERPEKEPEVKAQVGAHGGTAAPVYM